MIAPRTPLIKRFHQVFFALYSALSAFQADFLAAFSAFAFNDLALLILAALYFLLRSALILQCLTIAQITKFIRFK